MGLMHTLVVTGSIVASSSSDDSSGVPWYALPFVFAIAFWLFYYNKYRNQGARYSFEETESKVTNLRPQDTHVDHRTGLRSSKINGRNEHDATAEIPIDKMWPDPPITS